MTKTILALMALCLSASAYAQGRSEVLPFFGYRMTLEQCQAALAPVGQRFAESASVQLLGVGCRLNDVLRDGSIDGVIRYASEHPVDTSTSDLTSPVEFGGHYVTMQECQSALEREGPIFVQQTGLTPFAAYCYGYGSGNSLRFRSRLEAVGLSRVRKWTTTGSWTFSLARPVETLERIEDLGNAIGLGVFEASIDRDYAGWTMTMDYYGEFGVQILTQSTLRWPTQQECEAKSAQLLNAWADNGPAIVTACDKLMDGSSSGLVLFWLSGSYIADFDMNSELQPTIYASVGSCEADRARVEANIRQTGYLVFGSTCGQIDRRPQIQMMVFSENTGIYN